MATYKALRDQIGQFTQLPEAELASEQQAVVAEVRARVLEYGPTTKDILSRKCGRPGATRMPVLAPKFQDLKINRTWVGCARAPDRIKGNNGDLFVIKSRPVHSHGITP